jgi:hypothetical protein
MPVFDFICQCCGVVQEHYIYHQTERVVCSCGGDTEKIWLPGSAPLVIDDTIPGGQVIENLTSQPKTYYSRSEIKRQMDALGVQPKVQHVGRPGGDKSPHTQRWI